MQKLPRLSDIPFLMQTSLFFIFPLEQWERSGWYSRKLFFPQIRPDGQVPESQSPSPTPHGKLLQCSRWNAEQCPSDKQYSQFEWLQSESVLQVLLSTTKEVKEVLDEYIMWKKS